MIFLYIYALYQILSSIYIILSLNFSFFDRRRCYYKAGRLIATCVDATLLTRETLYSRVSLRLTFAHLSTGSSEIDMPIKPHLGIENVSTPRAFALGMLILISAGRMPETIDYYYLISNHR